MLYTYMKKVFTTFLNFLFWLGDCFLLLVELLTELVVLLFQIGYKIIDIFSKVLDHVIHYMSLTKVPKLARPLRKEPTSFLDGIFFNFGQEIMSGLAFALTLYLVPFFGDITFKIFIVIEKYSQNVWILILFTALFFLPQQRIFRDPVSHYFWERGWFKHWGEAVLCAQLISFFIMFYLILNVWTW